MKKLLLIILLVTPSFAADDDSTNYGPISISSQGTNTRVVQPTLIQFNAPDRGTRNCVTDISVSGDAFPPSGWTVYILDGIPNGATAYALNQTTMNVVESWYPKNPLCLSMNTTTYVYVSTGNFKLNMSGYQKSR